MARPYRTLTGTPTSTTQQPPPPVNWAQFGVQIVPPPPPDIHIIDTAITTALTARLNTPLVPPPSDPLVMTSRPALGKWLWPYLWEGKPLKGGDYEPVPLFDPMTLFLMSVLARLAYVSNDDARDWLKLVFTDDDTTYNRYAPSADPSATYDVWRIDSQHVVVAFPGTASYTQWLSYLFPGVIPASYIPNDFGAWVGVKNQIDRWMNDVVTRLTGMGLAKDAYIFVGHSLGGAIAQAVSVKLNTQFQTQTNTLNNTVAAVYSFGCPAWLKFNGNPPTSNIWQQHLRVVNAGDPVPMATQVWWAKLTGELPDLGRFFPAFRRESDFTRHICAKTVSTAPNRIADGDRNRLTDALLEALTVNGDAIHGWMTMGHSVTAYADALEYKAQATQDTPYRPFQYVQQANKALKNAGQ